MNPLDFLQNEPIGKVENLIKSGQLEVHEHLFADRVRYNLPNGWGLSCINSPMAHAYPFAWEIAVLGPDGVPRYDTELTDDVEVFYSDDKANEFIRRAVMWAINNVGRK